MDLNKSGLCAQVQRWFVLNKSDSNSFQYCLLELGRLPAACAPFQQLAELNSFAKHRDDSSKNYLFLRPLEFCDCALQLQVQHQCHPHRRCCHTSHFRLHSRNHPNLNRPFHNHMDCIHNHRQNHCRNCKGCSHIRMSYIRKGCNRRNYFQKN